MSRYLYQGCTGGDVKVLQRLLNFHLAPPRYAPRLAIDGIFGPKTRGRVVLFQTLNRLKADGIVGPQTRGTLLDVRSFDLYATLKPPPGEEAPARQNGGGAWKAQASPGRAKAKAPPLVFAQAADPPAPPGPAPSPPGPATLVQRTVSFGAGEQVSINPYLISPTVLTGQVNWLFRRDGMPDQTLSVTGQAALNQQSGPRPNGGWTAQGSVQWGFGGGLWKLGPLDWFNPFVLLMLTQNQGQPLSFGLGIGDQVNFKLFSQPVPGHPDLDRQNLSLFINNQVVTNVLLPLALPSPLGGPPPPDTKAGMASAPGVQILGGVIYTFDWPSF
jgi:peptidoglycan hydrolase-like protein with peptidoglycan-binding domain